VKLRLGRQLRVGGVTEPQHGETAMLLRVVGRGLSPGAAGGLDDGG
jgi:hypothetical protein